MKNTSLYLKVLIVSAMLYLLPSLCWAQFNFSQYFETTVRHEGEVPAPWIGGLNGVQYAQIDLNKDNEIDLVAFDRSSKITHCYLKIAGKYQYASEYNHIFPTEIYNFMQLHDFNQDGKQDLFTAGNLGLQVYENVSIGDGFSWNKISPFISYESLSGNEVNLQLAYNDYPFIGDIDHDGDIDILSFNTNGLESSIIFYKNYSVEIDGIPSMAHIKLENSRWGDLEECLCNVFAFGTDDCQANKQRATISSKLHVGGKSVFIADLNKDDVLELVTSHQECDALFRFLGGSTGTNPIYNSFTTNYPENTEAAAFAYYPNTMLITGDDGAASGLIVSPNLEAQLGIAANFKQSNWYYDVNENGAASLKTKAFLQEDMIDGGIQSSPAFLDHDKDGDLDLLFGYTNTSDIGLYSAIRLYENAGNNTLPIYQLIDDDYLSFSNTNYTNLLLQIKDLNLDGIEDLAYQATENGQNKLFIQLANSNGYDAPIIIEGVFIGFGYSFHFTQVTGSESIDLLIGKSSGGLILYENISSGNQFTFEKVSDNYLSIKDDFFQSSLKVFAADMDANQMDDLIVTDQSGHIKIYPDYQLGTQDYDSIAIYNGIQDDFMKNTFGSGNTLCIAPLFSTSYPSIMVGSISGGLRILRNELEFNQQNPDTSGSLVLYPNPNKGTFNIQLRKKALISVISVKGEVLHKDLSLQTGLNQVKLNNLESGIYIISVRYSDGQLESKKILIQ